MYVLCICTVHIYVWELGQYMCVCIHIPKGLLVSGHPDMLLGKFGHLSANSLHQFQHQIEGQCTGIKWCALQCHCVTLH